MKILLAASAPWILEQITIGLCSKELEIRCVNEGSLVRNEIVDFEPDILIADMQIGNMGGIAVAIDARMEAEEQRAKDVGIILLLDRHADRVLAERANVDATMIKPVDIYILRNLVRDLADQMALRNSIQDNTAIENGLDIFDNEGIPTQIN